MRKRLRKVNSILLALLLLCVFALPCGNVSFAASSGSLTLECVYHKTNGNVYLSDDEYSIALIANATVNEQGIIISFEILPAYVAYDCDWAVQTASVLAQKAEQLKEAVVKAKGVLAKEKTDIKGTVTFSGLLPGLYLVYRSKTAKANATYTMQPFLVAIPQNYKEGVVYDIKVSPKIGGQPEPDVPAPTDPPDPNLPQTGQLSWPIPVLAILGVGLFLLGLILKRRDRKKDRSE